MTSKQRVATRAGEGVTTLPLLIYLIDLASYFMHKLSLAVATLPQYRRITPEKPLHLFRSSVASLRENAIYTFQFNTLRNPPVFSPVVPVIPSSQKTPRQLLGGDRLHEGKERLLPKESPLLKTWRPNALKCYPVAKVTL